MSDKNIRFHSAEEALTYLVAVRDLEGSCGSVSGRAAADGELGLAPDGDCFGPDATDKIAARIDLERTVVQDLDWRYRRVLALFIGADCVRTYPEREDGTRRPGAHAEVMKWARCTPRHAHWLIDKMLSHVDRSLWRMGYLYANPDATVEPGISRKTDDDGFVRATRNSDTISDNERLVALDRSSELMSCPYEFAAAYYTAAELAEFADVEDE
ncbi:hypothetical protein [Desulfovibrio sp. Huiquan2017]|uniref:hypothetical protein n=1 Tax=Desulfovibrio sp. Huiquan2017 TaxID=2816861 RepID=UPI001A918A21|nr:hypothetical protein [Desulfovibrio sp. Huiquan2017]